ncbi:MAG: PRC-barrel domain-containing protein [Candidatus Methylomirabilales bacterium]
MASRGDLSFYRDLLYKPVIDRDGRRVGALQDLAADSPAAPAIQRMVIRPRGPGRGPGPLILSWQAVESVEGGRIRLRQAAAELTSQPLASGAILLRRHLMDQQVVDCRGAKLQRVNDLTMGLDNGDLLLCGMDTGARGFLTRLGYRWGLLALARPLYRRLPRHEIAWALVDRVEPARGHIRLRLSRDEVRSALRRPEAA